MTATDQGSIRALLAQPLVGDDQPEVLVEIRRHRRDLERFFGDELGYRLDASRPGRARLAKVPGPAHAPRGLRTRSGKPFDRRRYALACLVLAATEAAGERTTLARLFSEVDARASGVEGLGFSTESYTARRAFVQAVQAVEDLGVLELAEGSEERFARGESGGDALYRIDRERLALLPTTPSPPSLLGSPAEMAADVYPDTEEGRIRRRRHRVMRALVEQPVVYAADLSDEECDYLTSQRARIERILRERIGLHLEVRAEGWVAVDEDGSLTDLRWPDYGTVEVAALRLCDELRARRSVHEIPAWPWEEVVAFVASLAQEYAGYWRQDASTEQGAAELAAQAVALLVALRLVARLDGGIAARPAVARFAVGKEDE